ncbi:MAG: phospholipid carrier-dependent glycosyltransferase [Pleurocapsa minor GSE-CHR-MK-17-07R]|jgi:hypothetical protein|nr:phospholipid carrier-dependent glycosyltransferase [Pleurocapsa minor GSE-CHR-MK 17-07R]
MTTRVLPQTQPVVSPRPLQLFHRVLMGGALLVLLGYFAVYVAFAANLIQFPFDYDQGEGFELVDTIMFSQGQWPYQDTDTFPFYSSNYPPLFHVIAAPFVWLFGPGYWYGRLLGFLGTLITAAAIGYAVYREGGSRTIGVLSALAFLASNTVYHIGPLFRQHMTMVMFETLAAVILARACDIPDQRQRRIALGLGLVAILCAGYTKQLAYATAGAACLFLFIRGPRRAIIWTAILGVIGGAIFLWLNIATNGQWWLQTISANVNEFYADQTIGLYRLWFSLHGFLIVPAALLVVYELYFSRLSFYSVWFIAAVANAALSGKWGAGDSYFATSIAAMCILSGIFAARSIRADWTFPDNYLTRGVIAPLRRAAPALAMIALIVVPLGYLGYARATLKMPTDGAFAPIATVLGLTPNADNNFYDSAGRIAGGYADIGHFTSQADIDAGWRIVERVRQAPGLVLSEEAAFTIYADRPVITNPTQLLNLWLNNQWDSSELVGMLENREFGLIVLRAQFYPTDVLIAIGQHYEQVDSIFMNGFDYLLWEPINPA